MKANVLDQIHLTGYDSKEANVLKRVPCPWYDYLLFYVPLKIFFTIWAGEGLQNLGLCSALGAFEQGGSLSCHTRCDTGPWFFRCHLKDRPIQSPLTTHRGVWRTYSNQDRHGVV
jgi:hypothetical protein